MIPNNTLDVQDISGMLPGREINFGFDPKALDHLMGVLTDMYEDTIMAPIREYSTNARDEHIACGIDQPIRITPPGRFNPTLTIRDYGRGLSYEDIERIYSNFGASTKRESNDYNGSLGIGSKSAMTYTPVFTIVSVNNGMRYEIEVRRKASGGVKAKFLVETPDTETPSGVEVRIPVSKDDVDLFNEKIVEFFQWWNPEHYVVEGVTIPDAREGLTPIGDSGKLFTRPASNRSYYSEVKPDLVVMGNVAYPSPYGRLLNGRSVVYFADNGEAVFTRNREGLMTVAENEALYQSLREQIAAEVEKDVAEIYSKATSNLEAWALYRNDIRKMFTDKYGNGEDGRLPHERKYMTFNGVDLNNWLSVFNSADGASRYFYITKDGTEVGEHWGRYNNLSDHLHLFGDVDIFVLNAPTSLYYGGASAEVANRAIKHLGLGDKKIVCTDMDAIPDFYTKHVGSNLPETMEWADFRKASNDSRRASRPKVARPKADKEKGEWVVIDTEKALVHPTRDTGRAVVPSKTARIKSKGRGWVYVSREDVISGRYVSNGWAYTRCYNLVGKLAAIGVDKIALVTDNQKADFLKRFPQAQSIEERFKGYQHKVFKKAFEDFKNATAGEIEEDDVRKVFALIANTAFGGHYYEHGRAGNSTWNSYVRPDNVEDVDDPRFAKFYSLKSNDDWSRYYDLVSNSGLSNAFAYNRNVPRVYDPVKIMDLTVENEDEWKKFVEEDPFNEAVRISNEISADYPLLDAYQANRTNAVEYINALYMYRNK